MQVAPRFAGHVALEFAVKLVFELAEKFLQIEVIDAGLLSSFHWASTQVGGVGRERCTAFYYGRSSFHGTKVLGCENLGQHLWSDIAAAYDGDHLAAGGELVAMEQGSSRRHSAARLGNQMRIEGQPPHRLTDFVFAHGDESVDVLLNVLEIQFAHALRSQAIGDGAHRLLSWERDPLTRLKAGLGFGSKFRLDAVDLGARPHVFHRSSNAADHPTASDA